MGLRSFLSSSSSSKVRWHEWCGCDFVTPAGPSSLYQPRLRISQQQITALRLHRKAILICHIRVLDAAGGSIRSALSSERHSAVDQFFPRFTTFQKTFCSHNITLTASIPRPEDIRRCELEDKSVFTILGAWGNGCARLLWSDKCEIVTKIV